MIVNYDEIISVNLLSLVIFVKSKILWYFFIIYDFIFSNGNFC